MRLNAPSTAPGGEPSDLHQLSAELPFYHPKDFDVRDAKSRLIRIWVRERERFAPRHFNSPIIRPELRGPVQEETSAWKGDGVGR